MDVGSRIIYTESVWIRTKIRRKVHCTVSMYVRNKKWNPSIYTRNRNPPKLSWVGVFTCAGRWKGQLGPIRSSHHHSISLSPLRSPHTTVLHGCHRTTELAEPPTHTHTRPPSSPLLDPPMSCEVLLMHGKKFPAKWGRKMPPLRKKPRPPWEFHVFYTAWFNLKDNNS